MSASTLGYRLSPFSGVLSHAWSGKTRLVRDGDRAVRQDIEAQVRSGDYFVTLATVLDGLNGQVTDYQVRAQIEDIVSDLIHLQDNYTIKKQSK